MLLQVSGPKGTDGEPNWESLARLLSAKIAFSSSGNGKAFPSEEVMLQNDIIAIRVMVPGASLLPEILTSSQIYLGRGSLLTCASVRVY